LGSAVGKHFRSSLDFSACKHFLQPPASQSGLARFRFSIRAAAGLLPSRAVRAAFGDRRSPACPLCGHDCDTNIHALSCPGVTNPSGIATSADPLLLAHAAGIVSTEMADSPGVTRAHILHSAGRSLAYSRRRWRDRCDMVAAAEQEEQLVQPLSPHATSFLSPAQKLELVAQLWPCAVCGVARCSCGLQRRAPVSMAAAPALLFARLHHGASPFRFAAHNPVLTLAVPSNLPSADDR
jgi:hypothetical protein